MYADVVIVDPAAELPSLERAEPRDSGPVMRVVDARVVRHQLAYDAHGRRHFLRACASWRLGGPHPGWIPPPHIFHGRRTDRWPIWAEHFGFLWMRSKCVPRYKPRWYQICFLNLQSPETTSGSSGPPEVTSDPGPLGMRGLPDACYKAIFLLKIQVCTPIMSAYYPVRSKIFKNLAYSNNVEAIL